MVGCSCVGLCLGLGLSRFQVFPVLFDSRFWVSCLSCSGFSTPWEDGK